MRAIHSRIHGRVVWLAAMLVVVLGGGVAVAIALLSQPGKGGIEPVPIVWDRETCKHCAMHIGEPSFAAQLQLANGDVFNFDDLGCLFEFVETEKLAPVAVFFRHCREDRWIAAENAAFVEVPQSPMMFNLGAVDRGTPGSISLDAAKARVLAHKAR